MIFRRLTMPAWALRGCVVISCNTPSTRYRTRTESSVGSMWMSDARSCTAPLITVFTNRTIGASSTISRNTDSSPESSSPTSWSPRSSTESVIRVMRSIAAVTSTRVATTGRTWRPLALRTSSSARTLDGSLVATTSAPEGSNPIGRIP